LHRKTSVVRGVVHPERKILSSFTHPRVIRTTKKFFLQWKSMGSKKKTCIGPHWLIM